MYLQIENIISDASTMKQGVGGYAVATLSQGGGGKQRP